MLHVKDFPFLCLGLRPNKTTQTMTTATAWTPFKAQFDHFVDANAFRYQPENLYAPVQHIMDMGGKRIRPMLLMLSNEAFGGNPEEALPAAYAYEVFHNFTLVHDDIMDDAEIRRGNQTVHEKYGMNAAILAGDVMVSFSYDYLSRIPAQHLPEAIKIFNRTAIGIMEGQQIDMDMEGSWDASEELYLEMIRKKTAILLAAALETGAVLAGASKSDREKIYEFGIMAGLAFQLRDDYLDAFGDERVGKVCGGDILQDKRTWLLIKALEVAPMERGLILRDAMESMSGEEKVQKVLSLMEEFEIPRLAQEKMAALTSEAYQCLDDLSIPADCTAGLREMADYLLGREY
jgi:geranylgeranyl diphosphate synthase type II